MLSPRTLSLCCILFAVFPATALADITSYEAHEPSFAAVSDAIERGDEEALSGELTPGRMGLYESAHMHKAGSGAWTSLDLGLHRLDYAISDRVQMGVMMALPIGFLGVAAELKFGGELAEHVHGAVTVRAATLLLPGVASIVGYGGHAALTYGSPDLHVTAGAHAYGISLLGMEEPIAWMIHPTVGGAARVSDFAVLSLDAGPLVTGESLSKALCAASSCTGDAAIRADMWLIKYGVRFHGDAWFGDVSFLIPAHESFAEVAKYLPLGLPTMTLGYAF